MSAGELGATRPTEADAVLCAIMRTREDYGTVAAQRHATDALDAGKISCEDYVWLVRWSEGRAA